MITYWEAMNWAKTTNQKAAMFLIDFEKAYDSVGCGFLLIILEAFGFSKGFCEMVEILLKDASPQVEINESLSHIILLSRSIKHGCPLAPAFFFIVVDAMFYLLKETSCYPKVKGITLPNNMDLVNVQLVDDTTFFLKLEEEKFSSLLCKLRIFCEALGAKVLAPKSILLGWDESLLNGSPNLNSNGMGPPNRLDIWEFLLLLTHVLERCGCGSKQNWITNLTNGTKYTSL